MEPSLLNDMRTTAQPTMPPASLPATPEAGTRRKIVMVVVLIAVLFVVALWLGTKMPTDAPEVRYDDAGNAITTARAGELVAGFPKELVREAGVTITESYLIDYSTEGKKMPFASYVSNENYESNVDGFRRLLQSEGWIIQKDGSTTEVPTTNFYALRDGAELNIVLNQETDMPVVVQISYLSAN